jgi:hypothetical protein
MIYVTGDTHGNPARLGADAMPFSRNWTKQDTLIVCGDFGYLFSGGPREEKTLRELSERPYTIAFTDGAHENFDMLAACPPAHWNGGVAGRVRRNIYHLQRGQVYKIEGHTVFAMGGGYSVDRARRDEGVDWWPAEMPSAEDYWRARRSLGHYGRKVDYIITHAAPESVMARITGDYEGERELNGFLQWVMDNVSYKRWYFGHLHMDVAMDNNLYAMFLGVRELTGGETVW